MRIRPVKVDTFIDPPICFHGWKIFRYFVEEEEGQKEGKHCKYRGRCIVCKVTRYTPVEFVKEPVGMLNNSRYLSMLEKKQWAL